MAGGARGRGVGRAPLAVAALATVGLVALAAPLRADLLRCTGPDGRTVFTNDAARCPGAQPFEPEATLQGVDPDPAAPPAEPLPAPPRGGPDLREQAQQTQAEAWRQKRLDKERELEQIRAARDYLTPFVGHCNRGGTVLTADGVGMKHKVSCSQLQDELDHLAEREAAARDYLEHGLPEECRRAGCLPGWIR
jgi:hypothetical protein